MAKSSAKKSSGKDKKSGSGGAGVLLWVLGLPAAFLFLPTILMLFIALLPTIAALLVERGPNRYAWICVGGLNFAGTAPYLLDLWISGQTFSNAFHILGSVLTLIVMYGCSTLGWLLFSALPPVVTTFVTMKATRRIDRLHAVQKDLLNLWGPELGRIEGE